MKTSWITPQERSSINKYLAICQWAAKRYTFNGWLTVSIGFNDTIYTRIEKAALKKYLLPYQPATIGKL